MCLIEVIVVRLLYTLRCLVYIILGTKRGQNSLKPRALACPSSPTRPKPHPLCPAAALARARASTCVSSWPRC